MYRLTGNIVQRGYNETFRTQLLYCLSYFGQFSFYRFAWTDFNRKWKIFQMKSKLKSIIKRFSDKFFPKIPENCDPIGSSSFSLSSGRFFHTSSTKFFGRASNWWPLLFRYVSNLENSFPVMRNGSIPIREFFGNVWTSHSSSFGTDSMPSFINVHVLWSSCFSACAWYRLSVHNAAAVSVITALAFEPVKPDTYWTRLSRAAVNSLCFWSRTNINRLIN